MSKKISVLLLTYNTDFEKIKLTLDSILCQKLDSFEIVVSDDGSINNHEIELKSYFQEQDFHNFSLQMNNRNQGTVRNIISGLQKCNGEYVKPISGGDCLYCDETLEKVYDFMKSKQLDYCHGLVCGYQINEKNEIVRVPYGNPFDINAYRKNNTKRIMKNLVVYSDNTCGAAICYEREFMLEYMNRIKDCVRLEEDIFQVLAIVEGRKVALFDEYMVWYEIGGGVSTKKHKNGEDPLAKDVDSFYHKLFDWHPENRYVQQRYKLFPLYKIENLYLRTMLRFFVNPDAIRYLIVTFYQKATRAHSQKGFQKGFLDERTYQ